MVLDSQAVGPKCHTRSRTIAEGLPRNFPEGNSEHRLPGLWTRDIYDWPPICWSFGGGCSLLV